MTTATERIVFQAPAGWWEKTTSIGEIVAGPTWTGDWKRAVAAAGIETHNTTSWVVRIEHVDPRHTAIRAGDYACRETDRKPVIFVRLA